MDGSHPAETPVPNEHIVSIEWWRTSADLLYPLGRGYEGELFVPYDWKKQEARYRLPDGTYFNNPEGDIHHRNEILEGPGDLELTGHYLTGDWRFTLGTSLPTGKIEKNPYAFSDSLAAHHAGLGLPIPPHRHIQFGSGTFDPILRAAWSPDLGPCRLSVTTSLRTPLYDNRNGYEASKVFDFSVGPVVGLTDGVSLSMSYTANYQTRAYWDKVPDENSGFFTQGVSTSMFIHLARGVTLRPNLLWIVDINTRGDFDTFKLDWIAGVALDIQLD